MAKIGYIYVSIDSEDYSSDEVWMRTFGCEQVYKEVTLAFSPARDLWDKVVRELEYGDTLVISRLSNALAGVRQMVDFFECVRQRNVRLVSIHDKMDTADEAFPIVRTFDLLVAVCSMAETESLRLRAESRLAGRDRLPGQPSLKRMQREERNRMLVCMYEGGESLDSIYRASGFKSKSSLFRILNEAGVVLNRNHEKGPRGPRKKPGPDPSSE